MFENIEGKGAILFLPRILTKLTLAKIGFGENRQKFTKLWKPITIRHKYHKPSTLLVPCQVSGPYGISQIQRFIKTVI